MMEGRMMDRKRRRMVNRVLVIVAVAALLGGLLIGQWPQVLANALWLCFSCMGLG